MPPNDWQSNFGGPAWTRVPDGQWYLHLFAPEQPDVNWRNQAIKDEFAKTLRFWFDRGIDGFRIDVAHGMAKDWELPDLDGLEFPLPEDAEHDHPHWDQPGVHEIFREWRRVADEYSPSRAFCGEIWVGRTAPAGRLPASGRTAHRVQLRLPDGAVAARPAAPR